MVNSLLRGSGLDSPHAMGLWLTFRAVTGNLGVQHCAFPVLPRGQQANVPCPCLPPASAEQGQQEAQPVMDPLTLGSVLSLGLEASSSLMGTDRNLPETS